MLEAAHPAEGSYYSHVPDDHFSRSHSLSGPAGVLHCIFRRGLAHPVWVKRATFGVSTMQPKTITHLSLALVAMVRDVIRTQSRSRPGAGSSHREAPLISQDPAADATDLYAFVSPDAPDTVTLIANYYPMQDPAGFPNFYRFGDDVTYRINIDNNGDAVEDVFYQWTFDTRNRQSQLVPLPVRAD